MVSSYKVFINKYTKNGFYPWPPGNTEQIQADYKLQDGRGERVVASTGNESDERASRRDGPSYWGAKFAAWGVCKDPDG